jgi:hypothetical protein
MRVVDCGISMMKILQRSEDEGKGRRRREKAAKRRVSFQNSPCT